MYMSDKATFGGAAYGLPTNGVPFVQTVLSIPCSNPYIGHAVGPLGFSQYQALGCANPGVTTAQILYPGLRLNLPRSYTGTHDDLRIILGTRGELTKNWNYDLSYSHWQAEFNQSYENYPLLTLMDAGVANGTLNIFQYGGDTPAQQQALIGASLQTGITKEDVINGTVNGDLGDYGVMSPFASTPVAVAVGFEHRHTSLSYTPDYNWQAGYVVDGGGPVPAAYGGEKVMEEFAEVQLPLIEDKPFAKSLALDLAFRNSKYTVDSSSQGFSTHTYRFSFNYQPIDDLRIRGGYNRAARAPNAFELKQGQVFALGTFTDPCAGTLSTAAAGVCTNAALGDAAIRASEVGNVQACTSFNYCVIRTGGNVALKPELADTYTIGAVVTPRWAPGLNASVDYWDVKVTHYIGNLSAAAIVYGCYNGQTVDCQYIHRDPTTGALLGNGYVSAVNQNLNWLHTRGLDFEVHYRRPINELGVGISRDLGQVAVDLTGTYLLNFKQKLLTTTPAYDCAGLFGPTCAIPRPNWRHTLRVTWETPWKASLSVNWRYIGSSTLDGNDPSNPGYGLSTKSCGGLAQCGGVNRKIPGYSYFDLSATYLINDKYQVRFGVNNVFDKNPPVLANNFAEAYSGVGSNGNTYYMYDTMGRVLFLGVTAKFQ
jgi:outer membrane receptor protein involved in Fe transport